MWPLHGMWSWGRLADLFVLDERQYRSPQACDPKIGGAGGRVLWGCDEFNAPARSMLGGTKNVGSRRPWPAAAPRGA